MVGAVVSGKAFWLDPQLHLLLHPHLDQRSERLYIGNSGSFTSRGPCRYLVNMLELMRDLQCTLIV